MSTHPEMNSMAVTASVSGATTDSGQMAWMLREFASEVPGVTHAVLLSRDGLLLLDSDVDKDWADELAAAFSGVASIAANTKGPGHEKRPARQVIIERDDCLFFIQSAGRSAAFENHPGNQRGVVDTVLAVIATTDADVGNVGFETGRLVSRFARYMETPVRVGTGDELR